MHHGCLIFCLSRFERVITSHVHTESLLFGRFPSRSEKRHGHGTSQEMEILPILYFSFSFFPDRAANVKLPLHNTTELSFVPAQ